MDAENQYGGFEKERSFCKILREALAECPELEIRTICSIIGYVAPNFMRDLFTVRPYVRKLRYVGYKHIGMEVPYLDCHFIQGRIYESIDFNGGTYSIKGYEGRRIGCAYFEVVIEESATDLRQSMNLSETR